MQLPAIREEEERRSLLIQDKEEEEDDLLIKEPMMKKKQEEEVKVKTSPLQEIWHQFEKKEEAEGQELIEEMVRKGDGGGEGGSLAFLTSFQSC